MAKRSSSSESWQQSDRAIDWVALLVSVVVTGVGSVAAAWWYDIAWRDIASSGFTGPFVFAAMFSGFLGMPAYLVVRLMRGRRRTAMPKGH